MCVIILYTAASFHVTYMRGVQMDPTLTTCVYSFFGGELLLLAGLKVTKDIKGYGVENTNVSNESEENTVG